MSMNDTTTDALAAACTEGTWRALMKHKSESMIEHPRRDWRIVPTTGMETTFVKEIGMGTIAYQFPLARMESEIKRLVNELSAMDIWDYPEGFGNKFDDLKTLVFAARNISRAVTPFLSIKDRGSDKRLKHASDNRYLAT
jgi:hypothetical protein